MRDVGGLANQTFVKKLRAGFVARVSSQEFRILAFAIATKCGMVVSSRKRSIPSTASH
jgi:hypothetical protein